jgi:hypothetical protein
LCYTQISVEQDHNFAGDGCRGLYGSGWFRAAILHPFDSAGAKSLSTRVLREQNLLRDVAKKHSGLITAAGEIRFQLQAKRDIVCGSYGRFAEPGIWHSTICAFQCRVWRAFIADARAHLHSTHLIHRR